MLKKSHNFSAFRSFGSQRLPSKIEIEMWHQMCACVCVALIEIVYWMLRLMEATCTWLLLLLLLCWLILIRFFFVSMYAPALTCMCLYICSWLDFLLLLICLCTPWVTMISSFYSAVSLYFFLFSAVHKEAKQINNINKPFFRGF